MNILASYNWIKEHLDTNLTPEEFARRTTDAGNSVERMEKLSQKFEKMVVGFVKKIEAHPNADKLRVATTDIGDQTVQIVCGGVNLAEGQRVVVGLPGARVRWHGQGELIELTKTKIRGVESFGMICAAGEIGFEKLSSAEKEIWDLTNITDASPGTPLVQALDMDDVIFDIEVTSNRVDCMSIVGQAREAGAGEGEGRRGLGGRGGLGRGEGEGMGGQGEGKGIEIDVKEPELCPKYCAIVIDQVNVGPSPWWLQKKLLFAGHRPINNIVDITNYVLHEYGQPLHAFDADKLSGEKIVVRKAKKNEKLLALDGKEYTLTPDMLVIADAKKAVAVAGIMGGAESGTMQSTTRIVIESATFDPVSVRRTARALSLYSDSQLLFEKGLSTQATQPALDRAIQLIVELAGGIVISDPVIHETKPYESRTLAFDPAMANRLMGIELSTEKMFEILHSLGFENVDDHAATPSHPHSVTLSIPFWRDHDIENSVDFVEEIARVYGYGNFPSVLPSGEIPLAYENPALFWQRQTKEILKGAGLTEIYSYAFISEAHIQAFGMNRKQVVTLRNPLSSEFDCMRPSLIPSMLDVIAHNQVHQPQAELFELAPVYYLKKQDLPDQPLRLLLAFYGGDPASRFFELKGLLERWLRQSGITKFTCEHAHLDSNDWHETRSAVYISHKKFIVTIGQVSPKLAKKFNVDVPVFFADIDFEGLVPYFNRQKTFIPIPTFPVVKRDLAFVVSERTPYVQIESLLQENSSLLESIELFDIFRGKGVADGAKSMAVHLTFRHSDRTLEAIEVEKELDVLRGVLEKEVHAMMRM